MLWMSYFLVRGPLADVQDSGMEALSVASYVESLCSSPVHGVQPPAHELWFRPGWIVAASEVRCSCRLVVDVVECCFFGVAADAFRLAKELGMALQGPALEFEQYEISRGVVSQGHPDLEP